MNPPKLWLASPLLALVVLAPTASPAGEQDRHDAYVWRNVEIVGGGYVPGIIFNTSEPGLVYARTDIGGAYRLDEATHRWVPLLDWVGWDNWGLSGVDSLATDAVDPDRVYVLAGTYTNSWDPHNGAILRSRDRGRTWQKTDLPFKSGGNMPGRNMGERLAIDPNQNGVYLYADTTGSPIARADYLGPAVDLAIPEPGTLSLLLGALGGGWLARRRRKDKVPDSS